MIREKAIYLSVFFILCAHISFANSAQVILNQADSLYQVGKYTESFSLYEILDKDHRQQSPAMLLRMAYIKEGLGDISSSLYYLNRYALLTQQRAAFEYMESQAKKHQLIGYDFGDFELIMSFIFAHQDLISLLLLLFCALNLVFMAWKKRQNAKSKLGASGILFTLLLAATYYWINWLEIRPRAIIAQNHTYLMRSPSAAAGVVEIVPKGHRLLIEGKKDVWYKTSWNKETVYVKENQLLLIP